MGKNNRFGQAEILSPKDISKIKKALGKDSHKLMLAIALYTAERWGAIRQLRVEDVYSDARHCVPHKFITFRASTRKAAPDGSRATRQVPINSELAASLRAYNPPMFGYLFPSPVNDGPVSFQAVDSFFREACDRAGLGDRGISTHSTRRTAITRLSEAGIGLPQLKAITGHKSVAALMRYIENDPRRTAAAIELLCA